MPKQQFLKQAGGRTFVDGLLLIPICPLHLPNQSTSLTVQPVQPVDGLLLIPICPLHLNNQSTSLRVQPVQPHSLNGLSSSVGMIPPVLPHHAQPCTHLHSKFNLTQSLTSPPTHSWSPRWLACVCLHGLGEGLLIGMTAMKTQRSNKPKPCTRVECNASKCNDTITGLSWEEALAASSSLVETFKCKCNLSESATKVKVQLQALSWVALAASASLVI